MLCFLVLQGVAHGMSLLPPTTNTPAGFAAPPPPTPPPVPAAPLPAAEPATLAGCLSDYISILATNTSRTWDYEPLDVATNRNVWTWPVNLSWLGKSSMANFQATLITSNTIVLPTHAIGAYVGQTLSFMDTNGVVWSTVCTNSVVIVDDVTIGLLRDALPPSVVPIWVLPPDFINYISPPQLGDLHGLPCVWMRVNPGSDTNHPGSSTIQLSSVYVAGYTSPNNISISCKAALTGPFGFGDWASSGDSGSPCFMLYNNLPVLLFTAHNGYPGTGAPEGYGGAQGPFFSDSAVWSALAARGLTNGLQTLDLSGLKRLR
jgi:hypothetical protein